MNGLAAAFAIVVASGPAFAQAKAGASLCHTPEIILFTCRIETKTVSICGPHEKLAENEPGSNQAGAVFRYGRQGRVEVEAGDLHRAFKGWAGGGETQVYADTPTHRHLIFDRMVRTGFDREGHSLQRMTRGLLVLNKNQTALSRRCTSPIGGEPPAFDQRQIEALVPVGGYVPH